MFENLPLPSPFLLHPLVKASWRNALLALWLISVGAVIAFLLLRSSPSATGLPMTPRWLIHWLNTHHDLRTLPMAWGYAIIPALLLAGQTGKRRLCLLFVVTFLLAGEAAQTAIPTRSFTWWDVVFSILGVAIAEGMMLGLQKMIVRRPLPESKN